MNDFASIGRTEFEVILFRCVLGVHWLASRDTPHSRSKFHERRQHCGLREIPCPDETQNGSITGRRVRYRTQLDSAANRECIAWVRVPDEDAKISLMHLAGNDVISSEALLNRNTVRNQTPYVELPLRHHVQGSFHVAVFCPAHESEGIVFPAFLVLWVVPAGTIGTGHAEVDLLLIEGRTGDVH